MISYYYPKDSNLPSNAAAPGIWRLGEVDSCLDSGFRLARRGCLDLWESVQVTAQRQGRGQLRRHWVSPAGNVYAALRLPQEGPFGGPEGSVVCGLLLAQGLKALGWPVLLKWPNDIVVSCGEGFCKLSGLLLEERGDCLLAGIGINVRSCPGAESLRRDAAMPATCLADLTPEGGKTPTAESLWPRLVKSMFFAYNRDRFFAARWRKEAESLLLWRHRHVIVDDGRTTVQGLLAGLASDGALRLVHDGQEILLHGGSLRLDSTR